MHMSITEVVMLAQQSLTQSLAHWRLSAALLSAFFGVALLYFAGFAHSDILHNATHDMRHAIVSPCH
jgi:cobalt transporter subunit CbtB